MDFDNVKENIQPLATGRNASILQSALNIDSQEELHKKRAGLENAILEYDGNDPLEPWFAYVSWIEQSCPSGGSESGFKKVLLKCLENFETDQRYFQDRRLIRIYIKFIDTEENPQELYQELYNAGIGTMVADFYICWAYYYDVIGNFKKADTIFRKGIEFRAQPYNELIQAHTNFGFAMSQRMLYQDEQSNVEFLVSLKKRRHALTSLNGSNVGSIRHETQRNMPNCSNLQNSSDVIKSNINKSVSVLQDNACSIPTDVEASKSIVRNIIDSTRKQENNREPGPWSKGSLKKKGNLFKGSNHNNDHLGFTILEDLSMNLDNSLESEEQENNFSKGIQLPLYFASKNHPQETWNVKIILEEDTSNAIPAYRKNYLYPKENYEFSLEEYLAYKWFNKRHIKKTILKYYNSFWDNEYSVGIRLYPNFASKNFPDNDNLKLVTESFPPKLTEQHLKLAVNYNKIYEDKTELQFEEILFAKWKKKPKYDIENSIMMTNKSVEETLANNEVTNYVMTSNIKNPSLQSTRLEENFTGNNINSIQVEQEQEQRSKKNILKDDTGLNIKSNTHLFEQRKSTENSNIKIRNFKIADLYSESENNKFNNDQKNEADNDFLSPNDSCSTHQFNFFIKSQSVSTPVNMINQINVINQNNENMIKNRISLRSIPFELPENDQTVKQLSTILETSESNTGVRKSSVDVYLSDIPIEGKELSSTYRNATQFINQKAISTYQHILTDHHLFSESAPIEELVMPELILKDNNKILNNTSFESCSMNPFNKNNTPTNLSCNPINFFEEKTENVCEVMHNRQTNTAVYDEEILDFLSKTPERKCNSILSRSGDYKIKNYTVEFPDFTLLTKNCSIEFPDLSLPTLSTPKNVFQSTKKTESLLNLENNIIPFNFHNNSNYLQLKPEKENIPLKMNKLQISKINDNSIISVQNKFKGNFALGIYSVLNNSNEKEKRNYKALNFMRIKNIINKSIMNDSNQKLLNEIFYANGNNNIIEKLFLFTNFNLEYFWTILRRSELIHLNFLIDLNKISFSEWFQNLSSPMNYRKIERLIQQKFMCIKENKTMYDTNESSSTIDTNLATRGQNLAVRRFSVVPFEEKPNKRKISNYLGYLDNISQMTKWDNNDEDKYKSIIQNNHGEINLDNSNEYICDQVTEIEVNPFSLDLMEACLQKIDFYSYISQLESCEITEKISQLKNGHKVSIKNLDIVIISTIGEGAYGKVFCGKDVCTGNLFAMKLEKPASLWEYFICLELQHRLINNNILCGFMDIQYALIANNASLLLTEFSPYGTLLDICNKIKSITLKNVDEYVVMVLISQILVIVDHLHASEIIHADIKAENFLLMRKLEYGSKTPSIQLIDFGVSIDLKQFPRGQQFNYAHSNKEFQCVEMRDNRPWSFQIDLYGVAAIIHILLFGKYMEIHKVQGRMWMPKQHMPRYLNKTIWDKIFFALLNIRNSHSMPNLQDLRSVLEQEIAEKEKYVKDKILEFNKTINAL